MMCEYFSACDAVCYLKEKIDTSWARNDRCDEDCPLKK